MTDFETHPAGTADRIEQLEAIAEEAYARGFSAGQQALKDAGKLVTVDSPELAELRDALTRANADLREAEASIPRFPDHMAQIVAAKSEKLPERISAIVAAIQSIPDDMRQYQWQADDKQSFGSKWVRAVVGDNGKGMGRQAIAEVVSHIGVADYIAAANPDSVSLLVAALTRANAAAAAAYEVAAEACADYPRTAPDEAEWTRYDEQIEHSQRCIRALATPDQTAALDRLIAEAVGPYAEALRVLISHTHECERELTEALYHADFCGESRPLTDARAILTASKKGGA